jgi:hypothetical protein
MAGREAAAAADGAAGRMPVASAGSVGTDGDVGVCTKWLARIGGSAGMTEAGTTEAGTIEAGIEADTSEAGTIEAGAAVSGACPAGA